MEKININFSGEIFDPVFSVNARNNIRIVEINSITSVIREYDYFFILKRILLVYSKLCSFDFFFWLIESIFNRLIYCVFILGIRFGVRKLLCNE